MSINQIESEIDSDKNWYTWQWLNEDNIWLSYSPYTIYKLEDEYLKCLNNKLNSSKLFKIYLSDLKKTYLFDLKNMTQTNEQSKYKREIKRIACDITNNDDLKTENINGRSLRKRINKNYDESKHEVKSEPVDSGSDYEKIVQRVKTEPENSDQEIENESLTAKKRSLTRKKKSIQKEETDSDNDKPIKKKIKSCAKSSKTLKEETTGK